MSQHLTGSYLQSGKRRLRTVSNIFVRPTARLLGRRRQQWLRSVQGLNTRFLVHNPANYSAASWCNVHMLPLKHVHTRATLKREEIKMKATELRKNLFKVLDRTAQTGQPVEVEFKGQRFRIVALDPADRFANLQKHPDVICGDLDDLIRIDWMAEWRP